MSFFKVYRSIFANELLTRKPYCYGFAFLDLLGMAAFKKTEYMGETVERGQLVTTARFLAKRWGWTRAKVLRFLNANIRTDIITVKTIKGRTFGRTFITIRNYDKYQGDAEEFALGADISVNSKLEKRTFERTFERTKEKEVSKKEVSKKKERKESSAGWQLWTEVNVNERGRTKPLNLVEDTSAAKTLTKRYEGRELELKNLYRDYLDDADNWLVNNGHRLVFLLKRIGKYENVAPKKSLVPEYEVRGPDDDDRAYAQELYSKMTADEVRDGLLAMGVHDAESARRKFKYDKRSSNSEVAGGSATRGVA